MSRQVRTEDAEAEEFFVSELVPRAREAWLERVRAEPRVMTAGMVRRLTCAARDEEERAPRTALAILDDAEVLLDLLEAPQATKDDLAGTLWKERPMRGW